MWDLQRNGGSVQATTERVLGGRALDTVCVSIGLAHVLCGYSWTLELHAVTRALSFFAS